MSSTAVIAFGRMNPMTIGHEKLVNKVKEIAADKQAKPLIYLSHTQDRKKNPLNYMMKVNYALQAFGDCVQISNARNAIDVAKQLDGKYDSIIFVGDKERSEQFQKLLNDYNGKEYNFDTITTVNAGDRTDEQDFIDSMSATKMRQYAINNEVEAFRKGLPDKIKPYAESLINNVRKGLKL